jgi:cell division protein FtsQ
MANKKNIKRIVFNAAWVVLGITMLIVLVAAMQKKKNNVCKEVKVHILSNPDQLFLNTEDILTLVNAKDIINKKTINEIDIKALEKQLEKNVWMDKVEFYFDKMDVLNIEVQERIPMFRVFKQNGTSFYMDKEHFILPLSNAYSARVPVFTNFSNNTNLNTKDSSLLESIDKIAMYINANPFWMAQIQQVTIVGNDAFEILPTIGKHTIVFGDTTDLQAKFDKLFKFYKIVAAKVGFDKYSTLNVKFKNQIVATNNAYLPIDTTKANLTIKQFINNNSDSALQFIDTIRMQNSDSTGIDTSRSSNNAARQVLPPKPTTRTPMPPKPTGNGVRRNNNNNMPKPTTPPRAVMPKRTSSPRPKQ